MYGFPAWYNDIVCSLPILSFILSFWLIGLWKRVRAVVNWWRKAGFATVIVLGLTYSVFLYYWNFLSVHFS